MLRLTAALVLALGLAFGAEAQVAGKLTLYTSQPDRDAAQTVEAFKKRHPGVAVEIFRSGTTEVMNKLQAEFTAGDPRADVLLIADAVSMERLKADGRLLPHPGADLSQFPAEAHDRDKTYFGSKLITTGIIVNNKATMTPKSWADLLKPEAKGQVSLPSPLYSGAAAIHMAALSAIPSLGPKYYESLSKNGAVAVRGNGAVVTQVAGGERMYGFIVEFMALNAQKKGSPVTFVFPTEGVSAVTEPVAALKTAKNPAAARAFIDFILSKEGQELAVAQGYLPARRDVKPPAGFPPLADVKLIPIDVPAAIRADEANKKAFADLFGG
ncbi:MAG: ABC transporter substrate-binding protein [Alphaproteobacteria bacterium]|nr:ABC transporter substrate-binding protein [Alphaproteobacteria bacterium]